MGYTTMFTGSFVIEPSLTVEHKNYLQRFSDIRHMKRNIRYLPSDPIREAVELPPGSEGIYFVGGLGYCGQDHDPSIQEYNTPPQEQPGLWCQWEPNEEGTEIRWNGGEKFYHYEEWLVYLLKHFFIPWGYHVNGRVYWEGENEHDCGVLVCNENKVRNK